MLEPLEDTEPLVEPVDLTLEVEDAGCVLTALEDTEPLVEPVDLTLEVEDAE